MKRRDLIKAMLASPVAFGLSGWADDDDKKKRPGGKYPQSDNGKLRVWLHGPFAVIVHKNEPKITAYVPHDPQKLHELQYYHPGEKAVATDNNSGKNQTFRFTLDEDALELSHRQPYIDHGFDDFTFNVEGWKLDPGGNFTVLELPYPDVITYVPPAEGVLFENGKTGMMPIDHILEYHTRSLEHVTMLSKELGNRRPLQCGELLENFEKYWHDSHDDPNLPMSDEKMLEKDLKKCAEAKIGTFFVGVGLPRGSQPDKEFQRFAADHGVTFFNKTLLRSIPQSRETEEKQVKEIGVYGPMCPPSNNSATHSSLILPASQTFSLPRLRNVASIQDCRGGGLLGLGG